MTKPAKCLTCGDENPENFYYGNKNICKKCKAKKFIEKRKEKTVEDKIADEKNEDREDPVLAEKIQSLEDYVETLREDYDSRISTMETYINKLIENINQLNEHINQLNETKNTSYSESVAH